MAEIIITEFENLLTVGFLGCFLFFVFFNSKTP